MLDGLDSDRSMLSGASSNPFRRSRSQGSKMMLDGLSSTATCTHPGRLVVALAFVLGATFAVCYAISYMYLKDLDVPFDFLSASVDMPPASTVGTFGLSIGSMLFLQVICLRYLAVRALIHRSLTNHNFSSGSMFRLNNVALVLGTMSATGAMGVACIQHHVWAAGHFTAAGIFFFAGAAYLCCQLKIGTVEPLGQTAARVRLFSTVLACVFVTAACVVSPVLKSTGTLCRSDDEYVKTGGRCYGWVQFGSFFEICTFISFIVSIATFYPTFRLSTISLTVKFCEEDDLLDPTARMIRNSGMLSARGSACDGSLDTAQISPSKVSLSQAPYMVAQPQMPQAGEGDRRQALLNNEWNSG